MTFALRVWLCTAAIFIEALIGGSAISAPASEQRFDVVIKSGRVVDGTGTASYIADVGINEGKIVAIGRLDEKEGRRKVDAAGLVVAPGFVDMMGQTATLALRDPAAAMNLLTQGITTINAGEGISAAPLDDESAAREGWKTMGEYFQLLELNGLPINLVQTIGHTQVRRIVLGDTDRRPNDMELEQMRGMVREAMEAGAIGVSTALVYAPAIYASTDEIVALAEVAGEYGGGYFTHMRNEGDLLLEAIDEALLIGRKANAPVHIFHLKTAGRQNWGKMPLAIARIKAARTEGQQVTTDIYPYINNGLSILAFVNPRHLTNGRARFFERLDDKDYRDEIRKEMATTSGWENWYRHVGSDWSKVIIGEVRKDGFENMGGKSVAEIAEERKQDSWDTFFDLLKTDAFALPESMTEANKVLALQQDFLSFCTDVGPAGGSSIATHPRAFGSFPRILRRYVRELGVISLERAVSQASAAATNAVFAYDRGRIAVGSAADVIVFDANEIADRATFTDPHALSVGMKKVFVNGELVLDDGKYTGAKPGRVIRGPGYARMKAPYVITSGVLDESFRELDRVIRAFMERSGAPGAGVAVTDHGRLVLARGYGYADIASQKPVTPTSMFRIASISKPITGVAIMQLVEQGKLKLSDRVMDILTCEPADKADKVDERWADITVEQCLQHRGGWDRDVSFDGMFRAVQFAQQLHIPPPAQQEDVIRCMLNVKLDFDPGERYAYSNFGYNVLGRIIERITGQDYESYVKEHVLAPLGIHEARIGHTKLGPNTPAAEVRYYSPDMEPSVFAEDRGRQIPSAYGGWNLEAMDAHGAWTFSAVDLARFACAFDDPKNCKILEESSIKTMFAPPQGMKSFGVNKEDPRQYYSLGWVNGPSSRGECFDKWHMGSLPGTATLMRRRADGRTYTILFNGRSSPRATHFAKSIMADFSKALDDVEKWPQQDLFSEYEKGSKSKY
jgi:N-acyl-D-amino-acid deacylase